MEHILLISLLANLICALGWANSHFERKRRIKNPKRDLNDLQGWMKKAYPEESPIEIKEESGLKETWMKFKGVKAAQVLKMVPEISFVESNEAIPEEISNDSSK